MAIASSRWLFPDQTSCGGFWMVVVGCLRLLVVLHCAGWFWLVLDGSGRFWTEILIVFLSSVLI